VGGNLGGRIGGGLAGGGLGGSPGGGIDWWGLWWGHCSGCEPWWLVAGGRIVGRELAWWEHCSGSLGGRIGGALVGARGRRTRGGGGVARPPPPPRRQALLSWRFQELIIATAPLSSVDMLPLSPRWDLWKPPGGLNSLESPISMAPGGPCRTSVPALYRRLDPAHEIRPPSLSQKHPDSRPPRAPSHAPPATRHWRASAVLGITSSEQRSSPHMRSNSQPQHPRPDPARGGGGEGGGGRPAPPTTAAASPELAVPPRN
jgi:hypothetical protein